MFLQKNNSKGFTLIELLVVIAIIGILSSVVLASLNGARAKARDVYRKSELKQLQTALEMYLDSNNTYPSAPSWRGAVTYGGYGTGSTGYIPGLVPNYISVLPSDPANTPDGFLYLSDGKNYKLLSHGSPESYPSAGQAFYDPVRPTWAWMVCSGEPACSSW
ncbi:MAG: prepilin-type N-terminal cleavage/methylation domain-containing protein [Gallionella sp.]|nr:prepilin-type N-terminal cleavage/methylation domain-containing protein [Gallionella sp.]